MLKGFLILAAVGAVFAYLVFNFVTGVEEEDPRAFSGLRSEKKIAAKYYRIDAAGDRVLDLNGVPEGEMRKVWESSSIRQDLLEEFPHFEAMRDILHQEVKEGPFREKLLQVIDRVEGEYLSGKIDSTKAQKILNQMP